MGEWLGKKAKWAGALVTLAAMLGAGWPGDAQADRYVFVLRHGGRLVGELLNPEERPRKTYRVKTDGGVEITLDASQVETRRYLRPEKIEYERIRPRYPDTVAGQWELAEWCRQHHLAAERERHLERIVQLDPDHAPARRALGYGWIDGQWKTQEQFMKEQGYVWYESSWRTPQEVKLKEAEKKRKEAEGQWTRRLALWRRWLNGPRAGMAVENIRTIRDPNAVTALTEALRAESANDQRRMLFIEALAHIGTPAAMRVLAAWALTEPVEEVALTCLDHLKAAENHEAVQFFILQLRSKDNTRINRAARALRHLGNAEAIPTLIDVLITTHKQKVTLGRRGGIGASFGTGGASPGGLTMGSKTVVLTHHVQNRAVLEALIELSGGKNFGFDVAKWKSWYAAQQRSFQLDARRG